MARGAFLTAAAPVPLFWLGGQHAPALFAAALPNRAALVAARIADQTLA
ncbi:hypothetical protein [Streptomyces sp. enrichment culture]